MLGAGGEEGPRSLFFPNQPLSLSLSLRAVRHYAHSNNTIIAHLVYMLDTRLLLNSVFQFNFTLLPSNICAAQMNKRLTPLKVRRPLEKGGTSSPVAHFVFMRCYDVTVGYFKTV